MLWYNILALAFFQITMGLTDGAIARKETLASKRISSESSATSADLLNNAPFKKNIAVARKEAVVEIDGQGPKHASIEILPDGVAPPSNTRAIASKITLVQSGGQGSESKTVSMEDVRTALALPEYLPDGSTRHKLDSDSEAYISCVQDLLGKSLGFKKKSLFAHEYGFGSMLHILTGDILAAVNRTTAVSLPSMSRWSSGDCPARNLSCFFDTDFSAGVKHQTTCQRENISAEGNDRPEHAFLNNVAVMASVYRPGASLQSAVEKFQAKVGWRSNTKVIGLHIRGSDVCTQDENERSQRTCDDLDVYIPALRKMRDKYGINNVFLATDAGDSIINSIGRFPEFTWWYTTDDRSYAGDMHAVDNGYRRGMAYMRDVELLARTDVIIGKFTSNVARLAVEARAARFAILPAFISLDALWCFSLYGGPNGHVVRGKFNGGRFDCRR